MQAGFLTAERGSEDEVIVVIHKVPVGGRDRDADNGEGIAMSWSSRRGASADFTTLQGKAPGAAPLPARIPESVVSRTTATDGGRPGQPVPETSPGTACRNAAIGTDTLWFDASRHDATFVITDLAGSGLSPSAESYFGKPAKIGHVAQWTILIYQKNLLKQVALAGTGPQWLLPPGAAATGRVTGVRAGPAPTPAGSRRPS